MCDTFSGLLLKSENLIFRPQFTDSHQDLVESCGLADYNGYVKWEFKCPSGGEADIGSYLLSVTGDQDWFIPSVRARLYDRVKAKVKKMMIIDDDRKILVGGCYILGGNATVTRVTGSRIVAMVGNSRIRILTDSTVDNMRDTSSVGQVYGSSTIGSMAGNSNVQSLTDYATVVQMTDDSKITDMFCASRVVRMAGRSRVISMSGTASVGEMHNRSKVFKATDLCRVGRTVDQASWPRW